MTEAGYINTLMEQLALSHPEISFKYIQNRQVKLSSSGNYSVKDVIYSVYGREIAKRFWMFPMKMIHEDRGLCGETGDFQRKPYF